MTRRSIHTSLAPEAIGPYSQAIEANNLLFVSGQIPIDPKTGRVCEGGACEQAKLVLQHIGAILKEAGYGVEQVVKVEVFVDNMENFAAINRVYSQFFCHEPKPARQLIEAAKLPRGVMVEISCIAAS